jgi:dCTP deaminase
MPRRQHKAARRSAGLLSDLQIMERLVAPDERCVFVSPIIDLVDQLGPSSLDVRLGTEFVTTRSSGMTHIDLRPAAGSAVKQALGEYSVMRQIPLSGRFVLHPGEFALGHTLEFIRLPRDIAARLEGRSSLGRMGIQIHATAGYVDPGFEGALTFELMNSGKLPVSLSPGIRLGQLCFFEVEPVEVPYLKKRYSKYGGRLGVESARVFEDPEIAAPPRS